tara:strand:- start:204 stop:887 length:684 start_codon:yes stop_codon:yes gene_type:complete
MSRIRADRIVDRAATGAPLFPNGAVVTGVATATTFDGNATTATSASGLTGTPDITVRNIVGVGATFSGVLSYEDVTNVDSVGIITAQSGVNVTAGGLDLKGVLQEKVVITPGKLSDTPNINITNGMVHYFTTTEDAQSTPNIYSSVGINTEMAVGDTVSVTIISAAASAGYSAKVSIDGVLTGITTSWVGGSAPSAGGASGLDIYSYQIIKTADATFTVIGNLTNAA